MNAEGAGQRVSRTLDPVLVPAGFQGGQHGGDQDGDVQIIFCAAHDEFSRRYPQLPQANQQQQVGTCVDLVMDIRADGTIDRLDLEGPSVEETLRHVGLVVDGEAVARTVGGSVEEGLPVIEAALRLLFGQPG